MGVHGWLTASTGLSKHSDDPFLGYRPIVDGKAAEYEWYT